MDIIIVNLTHTNMVQQTLTMTTHAVMMATQKKTWSYPKRTLDDDFISFAIETYGCFHSCFHSFFIACAQTIIAHCQ